MTLETFFSSELILENDTVLLRPLTMSDIDGIETISYSKELGEFGARVKNKNDLMDYYPTAGHLSVSTLVSLEQSFVDMLQKREDPRLFSFGDPI
ncbi:MAG: hypothetical protein LBF27_33415, partial [Sphingobacterium sp.]|nr:hypothetical protein [Sphingobacterium sp.]